jgi:hypothetical protein
LVEGYRHILQHNPGSKSNHSAREHARVVCVFGGGYMGPGPFYSHPTPHARDPASVIQPTLLSTHIGRGMGVCAGLQKSLYHLPMPTDRRLVKWGGLVLKRDRSGKDDTHSTERQHREGNKECWSKDKDTYYIITLQARAATQHANTREGEGGARMRSLQRLQGSLRRRGRWRPGGWRGRRGTQPGFAPRPLGTPP